MWWRPENVRIGNLMLDHRLDRPARAQLLLELEAAERADRKAKFGKTSATAELFDLVLNAESLTTEQMAELIETAVAIHRHCRSAAFSPPPPRRNCSFRCG